MSNSGENGRSWLRIVLNTALDGRAVVESGSKAKPPANFCLMHFRRSPMMFPVLWPGGSSADGIKVIVCSPEILTPDKSQAALLKRCLAREDSCHFFTREASGWRWVKWL